VTVKKADMEIKYGIIAYTLVDEKSPKMQILHFCGYETQPTQSDFNSLVQELNTDPEFGLVGKEVFLMEASDSIIKEMARQLKS
jgi:hypothetical protein